MRSRGSSLAALAVALALGCSAAHTPEDATTRPIDAASPLDAGQDASPLAGCYALRATLRRELDALVACTRAEECGRELDPRCGCSSDRVARLDADTTRFDSLAADFRARCAGVSSSVLDRGCVCHEVAAPGIGCVEGTCVHTIEAPDCTFDGAQFRGGDSYPDPDEVNGCICAESGEGGYETGCTLLL